MSELDPNVVDSPTGSDQAHKRVRTSRPKVKTGCSVCKQRRIKCDEKRPSCTQCVRGRKTCSGYPPPSRHTLPIEGIRIAPKPAATPPPLTAATPPSVTTTASSSTSNSTSPLAGLGTTRPDTVLPHHRVNRLQRQQAYQQPLVPLASSPHRSSLLPLPHQAATAPVPTPSYHQPPPPPPLTHQPHPPGLAFTLDESLYFSLFRTETLSGLAGLFDSSSWRQRVLQDCHAIPAIQHAAVALGALFKTLEQGSRTPSPVTGAVAGDKNRHGSGVDGGGNPNAVRSHWRAAVQHYSLACNAIAASSSPVEMTSSADGRSASDALTHHHRTRLLVSTLLGTFDAFIGDHRQAIVQIQNGLSLLERLSPPLSSSSPSSDSPSVQQQQQQQGQRQNPVESDLAVVFTRLAISAKSYDLAFHFPDPYVIRLTSSARDGTDREAIYAPVRKRKTPFSDPVKPGYRFATLREARLAHEGILDRGICFLEHLQEVQSHAMGFFPREWEPYGAAFVNELTGWAEAFAPLFASRLDDPASSASVPLTTRDRTAIATLQMEYINAHVLFRSLFSPSEAAFDAYLPQFAAIIELAREVVAASEATALATRFAYCQPPRAPASATATDDNSHNNNPATASAVGCPHHRWDDPPSVLQGGYAAYHLKPSFTADLGIVPPLFMVATKCREPTLRRRAIALLRSSARREGMWDSELVARIGHWVMDLEESSPAPSAPSSAPSLSSSAYQQPLHPHTHTHQHLGSQSWTVPESRRVMIHAIDFDLRSRVADISVGSRNMKPGARNDPLHKATRISW